MARIGLLIIGASGLVFLSYTLHPQVSDCPLEFEWNMWEEPFFLPSHCNNHQGDVTAAPVRKEAIPVYRLRFSIRTCNKKYAGTTHPTWVKINGIRMFLNRPGQDHRRNQTRYYTMLQKQERNPGAEPISAIGQIKDIIIGKTYYPGKKNDWCISQFQIKLNNSKYFFFKKKWKKGLWLNNYRRQFRIKNKEIANFYRNNRLALKKYKLYGQLPVLRFKPDWDQLKVVASLKGKILLTNYILREILISQMGDSIHLRNNYSGLQKQVRRNLKWGRREGRRYVDIYPAVYWKPGNASGNNIINFPSSHAVISRKNLHIDFDLKWVLPYFRDPAVDIDFNLNPRIVNSGALNWEIELKTSHAKIQTSMAGINTNGLAEVIGDFNIEEILKLINGQSFRVNLKDPIGELLETAEEEGNVAIKLQEPKFRIKNNKHLLIAWE